MSCIPVKKLVFNFRCENTIHSMLNLADKVFILGIAYAFFPFLIKNQKFVDIPNWTYPTPIPASKIYCINGTAVFLCGWIFFRWTANAWLDAWFSQQSGHCSILFDVASSKQMYLRFWFLPQKIIFQKIILKNNLRKIIFEKIFWENKMREKFFLK